MSISVTCDSCFSTFVVKNEHVGKRGKCPDCGSSVVIPRHRRPRPQPHTGGQRGRSQARRQQLAGMPVGLVAGVIGGVVAVLALVFIVLLATGSSDDSPERAPEAATVPRVAASDVPNSLQEASPSSGLTNSPADENVGNSTVDSGGSETGTDLQFGTTDTTISTASDTGLAETNSETTTSSSERKKYDNVADLIEAVMPSVCRINSVTSEGGVTGSGFVVDREGTVVTNYHVVVGSLKMEVEFMDGSRGRVIGYQNLVPEKDIAVLRIDYPREKIRPVKIATIKPRQGEVVVALGAPLGLSFSSTDGKVSAIREASELRQFGLRRKGTWIQTTAPISPGNSGGPLFNIYGEVLGANTFTLTTGQNLNFAIGYPDLDEAVRNRESNLVAVRPSSTPDLEPKRRRRRPRQDGEPGEEEVETVDTLVVVDGTKTTWGIKLFAGLDQVTFFEFHATNDPTGKITEQVKRLAQVYVDKAGLDVTTDRRAPALMIVLMEIQKKRGLKTTAQELTITAQVLVRDMKNREVVKVWERKQNVGTFAPAAITQGKIPKRVKTGMSTFFKKFPEDHAKAIASARRAEREAKAKKSKSGK